MAATLISAGLSSCVLNPDPVPEMPYRPRAVAAPEPQEEPVQTTTWESAPDPSSFITSAPLPTPQAAVKPAASSAPIPTPVTASIPAASAPLPAPVKQEPKPIKPLEIAPIEPPKAAQPEPAPEPTPAPAPEPEAPTSADLKQITNTGPIPTAARVEGDPTRVWNPLDPSKKIRIINPKTNQPYPSGKKLKVRGTNFQFYVP